MAEEKIVELGFDVKDLEGKTGITEEQGEKIAEQAVKEFDEENMSPEEKETKEKKDAEETEAAESKAKEEKAVKLKELELPEGASDEDIASKEKEIKDKDKPEPKDPANPKPGEKGGSDLEESVEDKQAREEKEAEDKKVQEEADKEAVAAIVESEKVSEEDAKEILVKDKSIIEKYQGNNLKLARGYRHAQTLASDKEKELKSTQGKLQQATEMMEASIKITPERLKDQIKGEGLNTGKEVWSEGVFIQKVKDKYPDKTNNLDDEAVLDFGIGIVLSESEKATETANKDKVEKAKSKRIELMKTLPEDAKEFEKEVSEVLNRAPDGQVVSEAYDLVDIVRWAKGGKYDDVKKQLPEEYKKGVAKGRELATAEGEIKDPLDKGEKGKGKGKGKGEATLKRVLTDDEKQRAVDMYGQLEGYTDLKCYEDYIDTFPEGEPDINTNVKKKKAKEE